MFETRVTRLMGNGRWNTTGWKVVKQDREYQRFWRHITSQPTKHIVTIWLHFVYSLNVTNVGHMQWSTSCTGSSVYLLIVSTVYELTHVKTNQTDMLQSVILPPECWLTRRTIQCIVCWQNSMNFKDCYNKIWDGCLPLSWMCVLNSLILALAVVVCVCVCVHSLFGVILNSSTFCVSYVKIVDWSQNSWSYLCYIGTLYISFKTLMFRSKTKTRAHQAHDY